MDNKMFAFLSVVPLIVMMDEAFLSCVNNFLLSKKILKGEI
jgi:hypothetical protein